MLGGQDRLDAVKVVGFFVLRDDGHYDCIGTSQGKVDLLSTKLGVGVGDFSEFLGEKPEGGAVGIGWDDRNSRGGGRDGVGSLVGVESRLQHPPG